MIFVSSQFSTISSTLHFASGRYPCLARATLITKRHLVLNLSKTKGKPMVLGLSLVVLGGSGGLLGGPLGHPGGPSSAWKPFFFRFSIFRGLSSKTTRGYAFRPPLGTLSGGPFLYRGLQNSSAGIGFEPWRPEKGCSEKCTQKDTKIN